MAAIIWSIGTLEKNGLRYFQSLLDGDGVTVSHRAMATGNQEMIPSG